MSWTDTSFTRLEMSRMAAYIHLNIAENNQQYRPTNYGGADRKKVTNQYLKSGSSKHNYKQVMALYRETVMRMFHEGNLHVVRMTENNGTTIFLSSVPSRATLYRARAIIEGPKFIEREVQACLDSGRLPSECEPTSYPDWTLLESIKQACLDSGRLPSECEPALLR